jgi:HlyD family secretion protein
MTQIAIPNRKRAARVVPLWVYAVAALGTLAVIVGVVVYASRSLGLGGSPQASFKTVPVKQGLFESRVVVKGDLQAVENIDIVCQVEGSSTITELAPEGAFVHKGDILVVLDSSQIRQKLEDALIEWQRQKADVTTAEEMLEIQKSQNAANLEAAEVALQLAQIDMIKYIEGEYPGLLADAKMALEKADTGLKTKQDDLAQTRQLFSKGFVTATEVKNKELEVAAAQRDVIKAQSDMDLLVKYTHKADLASKKNALAQAEQKLERTKRENSANLSQKSADLGAKRSQLEVIERRVARFREQVEACTVRAPADGLVVYRNEGNRDSTQIQEGASVRERQTMMRLPDTSRMKVVLKINESQISALALGQVATVRLSSIAGPLMGTVTKISPIADSADRWMNPDRRDYPVDVVLDETPKGLKPGMSAQVSILTNQIDNAVSIPVGALYSIGNERYAFTVDGEVTTPAKVEIGTTNESDVQITAGLQPGEKVLLLEAGQGKVLLERAGIKIAPPAEGEPGKRRRRDGGEQNGPGKEQSAPKPPAEAPAAGKPAAPAALPPKASI